MPQLLVGRLSSRRIVLEPAHSSQTRSRTPNTLTDDIPEAVRDAPPDAEAQGTAARKWAGWIGGAAGLVAAATAVTLLVLWQTRPLPETEGVSPVETSDVEVEEPEAVPEETEENAIATEDLLGHLPYEEAPPEDLEPVSVDGVIQLRRNAADAYLDMEADARADGIYLVPLSGFRSVDDQEYLFFDIKAQRGEGASERAEVSAPPGYSEHHTGYAVDIGDADVPATYLSTDFENTAAFRWLEENAPYYSFELSFPEGNPQGIAYEPWHWRYVGDRHSLETFYKARSLE